MRFSPEEVERGRRYHRPRYLSALAEFALAVAALALLAFTDLGDALLPDWSWWAQALVYPAIVLAVLTLIRLPISYWRDFLRERRWGLSTQGAGGWLGDVLKGLAVEVVLLTLVFFGLVALARATGSWALIAAPLAAAFVVLLTLRRPRRPRADLQQVRAARRPGARRRSARPLGARGRADPRRAGRRREPAHDEGERVRVGVRSDAPSRPVRHSARRPRSRRSFERCWRTSSRIAGIATSCRSPHVRRGGRGARRAALRDPRQRRRAARPATRAARRHARSAADLGAAGRDRTPLGVPRRTGSRFA